MLIVLAGGPNARWMVPRQTSKLIFLAETYFTIQGSQKYLRSNIRYVRAEFDQFAIEKGYALRDLVRAERDAVELQPNNIFNFP